MNNEIGSASVSEKYKKTELCILLNALATKFAVMGNVIPAMNKSVMYESGIQKEICQESLTLGLKQRMIQL